MTRTLEITVGTSPDSEDIEETLAALNRGEDVDPMPPRLHLESLDIISRIFSPSNLELLRAIVEHDPASIRELAHAVDRSPPKVRDAVGELSDYGLVDLEDCGRTERPIVPYDGIKIEIPLTDRATR